MTRISFCALRSVVIVLLAFGLVPLTSATVEAGHGGGSGHAAAPPAAKQPSKTKGQQEIQVPQPVQVPRPVSSSRNQEIQTIKFAPDPRCAKLTEAQRRQTPGCG
jgi:hypothetical protein